MSFSTTWQGPTSWDGESSGAHQLRQVLNAADITVSGNLIRVSLAKTSSGSAIILGMSIGERDGSTYDFTGTPTRITFDTGNDGVTVPSGSGVGVVSDEIAFDIDETKNYMIHMNVDAGSYHPYKYDAGATVYFIVGSYADQTMDVSFTSGSQTYIRLVTKIEIDQTYGSDVLAGGSATASSTYGTAYPSLACDDDTATSWDSASGEGWPKWWQYDFGAGITKTVAKLRMHLDGASYTNEKATEIALKASNTGSFSGEEATLLSAAGLSWSGSDEWKEWTFSNVTAYRYYRVYIVSVVSGSYTHVQEFEMMELAGEAPAGDEDPGPGFFFCNG
jgi:hypothetical protein